MHLQAPNAISVVPLFGLTIHKFWVGPLRFTSTETAVGTLKGVDAYSANMYLVTAKNCSLDSVTAIVFSTC